MKKKVFFLVYCTLLAIFVNLSGFLTAQKLSDYLLQAVFLPVTLLLLYSLVKQISAKKENSLAANSKINKSPIIIIVVLFILLLAMGINKVFSEKKQDIKTNNNNNFEIIKPQ